MAIASLLLLVALEDLPEVSAKLKAHPSIIELKKIPETSSPSGLALVLEVPGQELHETLKTLESMPKVVGLNLVYVNYEDDLETLNRD